MKGEIGVDYTVIHIKFSPGAGWDGTPFWGTSGQRH